jgi:EAL domain-containing protein (putative c-di-GMP-specific phosphodiesterase class I)
VQQALTHPNVLAEAKLAVTASIGVALFPDHGSTAEQLLRMADLAVYRAKQLGRNRTCVAGEPLARMPGQDLLAGELQGALASNQLCLYYQPKVCARTYRALGVEALVRWQHPQRGLLAPGAFLPAIVGTPLEVALDLWVLRTAMTQLARWRTAGRDLHVAINISPGTLVLPDLASRVTGIVHETVAQHLVPLDGIELEVLETAALQDLGVAGHAIEACAAQGISFALDDFGTGYSSLAYLRRLPVRTLKIDRSFVSGMLANPGDMHIVRAVIGLAEAFGVTTVAEGVETHEHARVLAELGCHQLQGYWIGKPMPELALQAWLEAQPRMLQQYVLPAAQRSGEVTA